MKKTDNKKFRFLELLVASGVTIVCMQSFASSAAAMSLSEKNHLIKVSDLRGFDMKNECTANGSCTHNGTC